MVKTQLTTYFDFTNMWSKVYCCRTTAFYFVIFHMDHPVRPISLLFWHCAVIFLKCSNPSLLNKCVLIPCLTKLFWQAPSTFCPNSCRLSISYIFRKRISDAPQQHQFGKPGRIGTRSRGSCQNGMVKRRIIGHMFRNEGFDKARTITITAQCQDKSGICHI